MYNNDKNGIICGKITNDKKLTIPFQSGSESSTTKPSSYNIIILTNA